MRFWPFWAFLFLGFAILSLREWCSWQGLKKWPIHAIVEQAPVAITAKGLEPLTGKDAEEADQMNVYKYLQRIAKENFYAGLLAMILSAIAALGEALGW